jgi:hypothetical protein
MLTFSTLIKTPPILINTSIYSTSIISETLNSTWIRIYAKLKVNKKYQGFQIKIPKIILMKNKLEI